MHEIVPIQKQPRGEIVTLEPVKVIQILNPFRPATERKETVLECIPGEYVWQTIERAGIKLYGAVQVNGGLLTEEERKTATTRPGDWITVAMGVGGGVWSFLATVGIALGLGLAMFFAPELTPVLAPYLATVVGSAIQQAGGLLISAFAGMFQSNVSALTATQTYNPAGPQTTAQPGSVVPKGYGVMGWGGNIISSFVNFDGTQNEYVNILVAFGLGQAKSISNILVNGKPVFGYRELSTQQRLGTNDQTPIFGFNQTVNGYPQEIEMLAADPPIVVPGTGTLTQELQVSVKFPGGLIRYDNNGNQKEVSFAYMLQYAVDDGSGSYTWNPVIAPRDVYAVTTVDNNGFVHYPYWVAMPTDRFAGAMIIYDDDINADNHRPGDPYSATTDVKVYSIDASNTTYPLVEVGEWQPFDANNPLQLSLVVDWWSGWRIVSQMTTTPFYDNVSIMGLAPNKYAVQVTYWGSGPHDQPIPAGDVTDTHYTAQGWLWNVNEVQYNDYSYPNMILVGLRALSTTQLSGQNMQVMATITHDIGEDTTLPPELAGFEHDNPAIVAFDILNNPLYGMGLPWSSVDIPAFITWAQFCDELVTNSLGTQQRRFVFAGVFDQMSNAWAALQKVAQMSRAQMVRVGNMYSVVLDAPCDPVQIFTVGNIKADSLQESWIGLDDRCNLVEVTFADALRNYRSDLPVSVIGASEVNSFLPAKTTRVSLLGCTNRDQAWQWAYFQLLSTQTLLRMITIQCPIEAVTCQIGSVIGVQHDVPQWGWGGRVQAGSTASAVNIDRDDLPAFTSGAGWTLSVQHPNVLRGTATILGMSTDSNGENFLTLSAVPTGRILLLVSESGKTQTKVFALTTPLLQNPNFEDGLGGGWTLGTGWSISGNGAGSGYDGSDSFATYTGNSSAAISNLGLIAIAPDASITATCQVQGSAGTTGTCFAQVNFYSAGGTLLGTSNGNAPAANGSWLQSSVTATAPAGTDYATVGAAVSGETTGNWNVGGFTLGLSGTLQVGTLGDMGVGQTVTLYDQNVIDIVLVAGVSGQTLTLETPLSQAPAEDSPWVYGQSQGFQPATLFRVTDLKQTSDFEVTIKGLEYNTLIYEDAIPTYGEVVSAPTVNASVSNVTLSENFQTADPNNPTSSLVSVGWTNGPNTVGALIYMRPSNLYYPTLPTVAWRLLANVKGTQYSFWAAQNSEIEVQVVGFDNLGNPAPQTTAPTATMTVLGPGGLPPAVTTFALVATAVPPTTQATPGPEFSWTSVDGVSGYEIRFLPNEFSGVGSDWATATVMADIAHASAAGVAMTWTAPNNVYGTWFIASYTPLAPATGGTPPAFQSSAFSTPQVVVYGTVADWTPIVFTGGRVAPPGGSSTPTVYDMLETGQTALTNAAAAQAAANTAQTTLNEITGTSLLTPGEKASIIPDYNALIAAQSANDAQAALVGVSSAAYDAALSTLTSYLSTLTSPVAWNDATGTTSIDGTTFANDFEAAYAAEKALLNAIAAAINTTSTSANSGVLLQNPNFAAGDVGWTKQGGWSIIGGQTGPSGESTLAQYVGPGTAALVNNQSIPCAPGTVISAACQGLAATGATGSGVIRLNFYSGTTYLVTDQAAVGVVADGGWHPSRLVATAPATATRCVVDFAVYSETTANAWYVSEFSASILPNSLNDVPDSPSTNRYAAVETGADKTLNHVLTTAISQNLPALPASGLSEVANLSWAVTANDPSDTFNLFANITWNANPATVGAEIGFVALVDGNSSLAFGFGYGILPNATTSPQVSSFIGSVTGLSAGAHTITVYWWAISGSVGLSGTFTQYGVLQQISS